MALAGSRERTRERPREQVPAPRGAARRQLIIEVATRQFLEHGYDGASLDSIVREMGGSKGTIYRHFQGKEELFSAVIRESMSLGEVMSIDADAEPADALRDYATRQLSVMTSAKVIELLRSVVAGARLYPAIARMFDDLAPRTAMTVVADYLSGLQSQGRMDTDDTVEAAEDFYGLLLRSLVTRELLGVAPAMPRAAVAEHARRAVGKFLTLHPIRG